MVKFSLERGYAGPVVKLAYTQHLKCCDLTIVRVRPPPGPHDTLERMKLLVTHNAPDLDAIASCWLFVRFEARDFANAKFGFVNPGETFDVRNAVDMGFSPEDIIHTDTGLGPFDHHQPERGMKRVCAASLVYEYLCQVHPEYKQDKALAFIVEYVNTIDHFEEQSWPEADDLKNQLLIQNLIDGVRLVGMHDDEALLHFGFTCLDGAYAAVGEQLRAQVDLDTKATSFKTKWGNACAIESANDEVMKLAQKQGFVVVVRKDPTRGNIRIKAVPNKDIDLTDVANAIMAKDTVGRWYFHPGKTMLLNGSSKVKDHKPSPLTIAEVVEIFKQVAGKKGK